MEVDLHRRLLLLASGSGTCSLLTPAVAADLGDVERRLAEQRLQTCSAANASGAGLQAEFFAATDFHGTPLSTRTDGPVELLPADWPAGPLRSARWRGWVRPPLAGSYSFHVDLPGARVVVARQEFRVDAPATIALSAGRYYPITLEMPRLDAARPPVRLEWTAPHGLRYLVPRPLLYLPT